MAKAAPPKALIIDANALLHRAWHALPPMMSPDGVQVNAAYGFTSIFLKILEREHPDFLAVCWDAKERTYRHEARPEYKAQRETQPDEFYAQIPLVKEIVDALGGTNVEMPGFEADDLLATFAKTFSDKKTMTLLLTSDRDVFQCIGPYAHVVSFKKGVTETLVLDEKTLKQTTGLAPEQIPDYKSLRGDPSDNLKGVAGIGDKTAVVLLQTYGDLDGIFRAVHDTSSDMKDAVRKKLRDGESEARALYPIVLLETRVKLPKAMQDVARRRVDDGALKSLFQSLGFRSLSARVFGKGSGVGQTPTAGAGRARHTASKRAAMPTKKEIAAFFAAAKKEKELIMHAQDIPQDSLFRDAPVVAFGSHKETLVLREKDFVAESRATVLRAMQDPGIAKVGHGIKTAWHWADARGIDLCGISFDTEIASYLLAGGEGRHDLPSCAAAHLEAVFSDGNERVFEEINAIRSLKRLFVKRLADEGLSRVFERFEIPLISILGGMERHGVLVDLPYFKKISSVFHKEKSRLMAEMEAMAGEAFNPASPQQLAHILFDVLEISTAGIKRGKTGISTAAAELAKLEDVHPIIGKITEFREVAKLLSTYVEALPAMADANGRIHTTYNQALTATGRLSSSNPNLQNIPIRTELGRKIRRGFIAEKGFVFLSCDYSQIELRIVAALANDREMIRAFREGRDIHAATAAAVWGIPEREVTKQQRRAAKAVNFGIVYGQGPHGLARSAGIPFGEAQEFIANYFSVYSGIYDYIQTTKTFAREKGYVETLFGRKRLMLDIHSPNRQVRSAAERMAINMPVQGTAADIMKLAMIDIANELPALSLGTRLLLQVHDELVFEVPEGEAKSLAPHIREIMGDVEDIGVPIVVDASIGKNWDEMQKI